MHLHVEVQEKIMSYRERVRIFIQHLKYKNHDSMCVLIFSCDESSQTAHDRNIARLMEMGFTADQALSALVLNNGDLLLSVNHLMGGQSTSDG